MAGARETLSWMFPVQRNHAMGRSKVAWVWKHKGTVCFYVPVTDSKDHNTCFTTISAITLPMDRHAPAHSYTDAFPSPPEKSETRKGQVWFVKSFKPQNYRKHMVKKKSRNFRKITTSNPVAYVRKKKHGKAMLRNPLFNKLILDIYTSLLSELNSTYSNGSEK